jgi:hypothetical protein
VRTHVELRTDSFPAMAEEDDEVNPGRYGKALALWLQQELTARGLRAGSLVAEDWGWSVPLENPTFRLWVGCGNLDEHEDGFLCFIEPTKPFVRKGLKKVATADVVSRVADAIDDSLRSHPGVSGVRWWTEAEAGLG